MNYSNNVMRKTLVSLLLIGFYFPASANLIENAGFEDPVSINFPATPGRWLVFSGSGNPFSSAATANNDTSMPRSGDQALQLQIDNTAGTFAGAFQDVFSVSAGESFIYSGWHKSLLDPGGVEIRVEWRNNASDSVVGSTGNLVPILTDEYSLFSLDVVVPTGADTARLVYAIQSFGGSLNQSVFLDDTSFVANSVFAPATLGLLSMGLLGLFFSRRK
jgi:hypothetical protein